MDRDRDEGLDRRTLLKLLGASLVAWPVEARAGTSPSADWRRRFEHFVARDMKSCGVPGMAVAVVKRGETVFTRGYGAANVKTRVRVTPDTSFHLASVSKVVTGTALMMLWEQGAFGLDDGISQYLDFTVANPSFLDKPITFRQLFTHTSSISDSNYGDAFLVEGDPTIPLRDFLVAYLGADGAFLDARPGERWSYSDVAIALAGYLVGRVSPAALDELTSAHLFRPLGMDSAAWNLAHVRRRGRLASPHLYCHGGWLVLEPIGYPDWPAGLLRCSARDLARYLAVFTNAGMSQGARILRAATVDEMLRPSVQVPDCGVVRYQALFWQGIEIAGVVGIGHLGLDTGASTAVFIDSPRQTAVLVLTNVSGPAGCPTGASKVDEFKMTVIEKLLEAV